VLVHRCGAPAAWNVRVASPSDQPTHIPRREVLTSTGSGRTRPCRTPAVTHPLFSDTQGKAFPLRFGSRTVGKPIDLMEVPPMPTSNQNTAAQAAVRHSFISPGLKNAASAEQDCPLSVDLFNGRVREIEATPDELASLALPTGGPARSTCAPWLNRSWTTASGPRESRTLPVTATDRRGDRRRPDDINSRRGRSHTSRRATWSVFSH